MAILGHRGQRMPLQPSLLAAGSVVIVAEVATDSSRRRGETPIVGATDMAF